MGNLYKQFYCYILILIGFSIMFISFLNSFNFFRLSEENIIVISVVIIPLLYLIFKSIYGLILLQDKYQIFHFKLISEFSVLYILGYNIIIFALLNVDIYIYFFESVGIFIFAIIYGNIIPNYIKHQKKYNPIIETIIFIITIFILLGISYFLLLNYIDINIIIYSITYIFMIFISYNYLFDKFNLDYFTLELNKL